MAGFTFQGENWAPPSLGICRSPSSALRQDPSSLQGSVCPDCSPNLPVPFWEKTGVRKITGNCKTCQGPQLGGRVRMVLPPSPHSREAPALHSTWSHARRVSGHPGLCVVLLFTEAARAKCAVIPTYRLGNGGSTRISHMLTASEEPGFAAHPWTPSLLLFRGCLCSLLRQAMVPADGEASWRAHYTDVQEVSEHEGPGSPSPPESSPSRNGHPSPE